MTDIRKYSENPLEIVNNVEGVNEILTETKHCLDWALNHQLSSRYLEDISNKIDDFYIFTKLISLASLDVQKKMVESIIDIQEDDKWDFEPDEIFNKLKILLLVNAKNIGEITQKIEMFFTKEKIEKLIDTWSIEKIDKLNFLNKVIWIIESWLIIQSRFTKKRYNSRAFWKNQSKLLKSRRRVTLVRTRVLGIYYRYWMKCE